MRSFIALRRQIDQLTMPPEDEGAKKIMADPARVPGAGNWEFIVDGNGSMKVIHKQEVHTGPSGLNIPELSESATDAEISAEIESLKAAKTALNEKKAGLAADAAGIHRSEAFNEKISGALRSDAEKSESADMEETAALYKSMETRREMALESIKGLTDMQAQFIQLLR